MAHAPAAKLIRCELTQNQQRALLRFYDIGFCSLRSPGFSDDGGGHPMPTGRELLADDTTYVERGMRIGEALLGLRRYHEAADGPRYILEGDRRTLDYIGNCVAVGLMSEGGQSPLKVPAGGEEVSPGQDAYFQIIQATRTPRGQ